MTPFAGEGSSSPLGRSSSPRQGPSCPQRGDSLETDVGTWVSSLPGKCPMYWLLTGGVLSLEFQPKVSSSSNHCLQLPQAAAEAKEHFPKNDSQPLPTRCRQVFQKHSLPSCPHHQLLNLQAKFAFSLREGERSQRLQFAGYKHRMSGDSHPIAGSSSSTWPATPCFFPKKSALGTLTFYHWDT